MRALKGAVPRGLADHRTRDGVAYRRYVGAKVARLGPLPADARPWLKAAGLLTVDLDHLAVDAETVRTVLSNGAGRRARERARVTLRSLERRAARLRGQLADAEARLAELAGEHKPPDLGAYLRDRYGTGASGSAAAPVDATR